jgi:hypothetical protein
MTVTSVGTNSIPQEGSKNVEVAPMVQVDPKEEVAVVEQPTTMTPKTQRTKKVVARESTTKPVANSSANKPSANSNDPTAAGSADEAARHRITKVLRDANNAPRGPEDLKTTEIHALVSDRAALKALKADERLTLLKSLVGNHNYWVAPIKFPAKAYPIAGEGVLIGGQEEAIAKVLANSPEAQRAAIAKVLLRDRVADQIYARVDKPLYRAMIDKAVGDSLLKAKEAADTAVLSGTERASAVTKGPPELRLALGVQRASRFISREMFPAGGPYLGLSSTPLDSSGRSQILLHRRDGETVPLGGKVRAKNYESDDGVFHAAINAFNLYHYGTSGRLLVPPAWVSQAADLVHPPADGEPLGAPLRETMKTVGGVDAAGKLQLGKVFELDPALATKLVPGEDLSPEALVDKLNLRLASLGAPHPSATLVDDGEKSRLRLSLAHAKLLLDARSFSTQGNEQLAKLLPELSGEAARVKAVTALVNAPWEFVRLVDGEEKFVIPASAVAAFDRVAVPEAGLVQAGGGESQAAKKALEGRLSFFGQGVSVKPISIDGVQAFAVPLELGRLLLKTSRFDFDPNAKELRSNNLYWSARFSDLVYQDFSTQAGAKAIENQLRRWGFNAHRLVANKDAEVLVASNGKMIMVADRGTAGGVDVLADLKMTGILDSKVHPHRQMKIGGQEVNLHAGFGAQVNGTKNDVLAAIKALDPSGTLPVHITGHSKGGAEAAILGPILKASGVNVVGGYGIEAARAGKEDLAELALEQGLAKNWYQFQLPLDPVPAGPPFDLGFRHYGTLVSPDELGQPMWDSTPSKRLPEIRKGLLGGASVNSSGGSHLLNTVLGFMESKLLDTEWTPPPHTPLIERE